MFLIDHLLSSNQNIFPVDERNSDQVPTLPQNHCRLNPANGGGEGTIGDLGNQLQMF
jgi:hypothetical protein